MLNLNLLNLQHENSTFPEGFLFKKLYTQSPLQALEVCNRNFRTPCIVFFEYSQLLLIFYVLITIVILTINCLYASAGDRVIVIYPFMTPLITFT